jgi:hypothetical protein
VSFKDGLRRQGFETGQREEEEQDLMAMGRRADITYIPFSREEAESAGLKIVCCQFRRTAQWEEVEEEKEKENQRR